VTDEELFGRYVAGEKEALADLVERYERPLYNFLFHLVGDRALAEDLFQEVFLRVHVHRGRFRRDARFRTWLYTIGLNLARDVMRKRVRRPSLASLESALEGEPSLVATLSADEPGPCANAERAERAEELKQAVAALPANLKSVLVMGYYGGVPYRDIARALKLPLGTVKSRMHQAVMRLGSCMKRKHTA
jgi:RNA polymerase sigma-70 factor (ECF subfamily)